MCVLKKKKQFDPAVIAFVCWLQSKSDLLTLDVFVELSLLPRFSTKAIVNESHGDLFLFNRI